MKELKKVEQTKPNVHKVLSAIRILEDEPIIKAYLKLLESLEESK